MQYRKKKTGKFDFFKLLIKNTFKRENNLQTRR